MRCSPKKLLVVRHATSTWHARMGQSCVWCCLETKEMFRPGRSIRNEQNLEGKVHCAIQMLCTDTSSRGCRWGGGDPKETRNPALKELIEEVTGRWFNKRVAFVGDYSQIEEFQVEGAWGVQEYRDITDTVVAGVNAMIVADQDVLDDDRNAEPTVKQACEQLEEVMKLLRDEKIVTGLSRTRALRGPAFPEAAERL